MLKNVEAGVSFAWQRHLCFLGAYVHLACATDKKLFLAKSKTVSQQPQGIERAWRGDHM